MSPLVHLLHCRPLRQCFLLVIWLRSCNLTVNVHMLVKIQWEFPYSLISPASKWHHLCCHIQVNPARRKSRPSKKILHAISNLLWYLPSVASRRCQWGKWHEQCPACILSPGSCIPASSAGDSCVVMDCFQHFGSIFSSVYRVMRKFWFPLPKAFFIFFNYKTNLLRWLFRLGDFRLLRFYCTANY